MRRTKRQHYVPQSYLKRFSFDGTHLHTYIIKPKTSSLLNSTELKNLWKDISITDVCVAKDYYTIDEQNPANNKGTHAMALEKDFFQNFAEPKLNQVIEIFQNLAQKILTSKEKIASVRFTEQQKYELALCAFIQYNRSPRQRHSIEEVDKVIRLQHKLSCQERGLPIDEDFKGLDVAFTHADKTYKNPYLWRQFCSRLSSYCLLLRVSDNGNFFTSDNPVVVHKLGARGNDIFNVNFYQDDFNLFFPLTLNLILEYYNPIYCPEAIQLNESISLVSKEYERRVNISQYINAEKFVFSRTNDFSLFLKPINQDSL